VIAGLVADGETTVMAADHIDRGYAEMDVALRGLGVAVTRISVPEPASFA
jgi:UDP-N-acetylglucosamine enolpyruvyl transferase